MKNILKLLIPSILFCNCEIGDLRLNIVNSSNDTIYVIDNNCVDTIPPLYGTYVENNKNLIYYNARLILPRDSIRLINPTGKWDSSLHKKHCKDGKLRLYFFKKNLLDSISQDSIIKNEIYTKKIKLNIEELESLKWRVRYRD